jgi:RNA polymerase-associated protein
MALAANRRSVMTLYSGSCDPYSHCTRIVLAEKNIAYDLCELEEGTQLEELAEINPYCTVPTLLDRDLVLYGSNIIMEYLDERFPHPPLMPVYPVARARSRLMLYRVNRDWYTLMDKILDPKTPPAECEQARQLLQESLVTISPLFREMPYFLSEEFSLVDCVIAPLLWRLPIMKIEIISEAKGIKDYAKRLFSREAFESSLTATERALVDDLKEEGGRA